MVNKEELSPDQPEVKENNEHKWERGQVSNMLLPGQAGRRGDWPMRQSDSTLAGGANRLMQRRRIVQQRYTRSGLDGREGTGRRVANEVGGSRDALTKRMQQDAVA